VIRFNETSATEFEDLRLKSPSFYVANQSHAIRAQIVTLTAMNNQGSVSWMCAGGGFILEVYLPTSCR
jgi:hypothetical protein